FVEQTYRQRGVAKALMTTAKAFAKQTGAIRITLSTQVTNTAAQLLYESLGYKKDEAFYHYSLVL
ncbi:MAG: GNAT family N-acetyltransferase, partial [Cyanobacteria bacterium J06627_8]